MKLYYAQIFYKYGFNLIGYFTKKQLKNKKVKHYTILEE